MHGFRPKLQEKNSFTARVGFSWPEWRIHLAAEEDGCSTGHNAWEVLSHCHQTTPKKLKVFMAIRHSTNTLSVYKVFDSRDLSAGSPSRHVDGAHSRHHPWTRASASDARTNKAFKAYVHYIPLSFACSHVSCIRTCPFHARTFTYD
jgi:hypothetical protein